jgi:thiosulfate dehydrogenase [quinone] large subunit
MTTSHHRPLVDADAVLVETDVVTHSAARKALAVLRIGYGFTFLWAFFDKLLALGFHTGAITNEAGARTGIDFMAKDGAWIAGGSPTNGFLAFGVPAHNPFKDTFNSMAGDTWVDWLFMLGLLGIGAALLSGVGMRFAAAAGALL